MVVCAIVAAIAVVSHDMDMDKMVKLLRRYGYFVILLWTFLEGETIVIIAGVFSRKIELAPWLIAVCAFIGSFCSDQFMFSLGRFKGEKVLRYFPKLAANVERAGQLIKKYDTILILGFRFVYGVRNVTPILLGIGDVSYKKFFTLNFIGAMIWALTFTFGGVYLGKAFLVIVGHVGLGLFLTLLGCLFIAGLLVFLRWFRTRRSEKKNTISREASVLLGEDAFWEIINRSDKGKNLAACLAPLSEEEIIGFSFWWRYFHHQSYNQGLWAVACTVLGGCGDDSFDYFRFWLVAQGKDIYFKALENADSLCDTFDDLADGESPKWEDVGGVAADVFREKFKKDLHDAEAAYVFDIQHPEIEFEWEKDDENSIRKVCPNTFDKWWGNDRF